MNICGLFYVNITGTDGPIRRLLVLLAEIINVVSFNGYDV